MVNLKHIVFSLILPITLAIIVPFILLVLVEQRSFMTLLTQNLIFLTSSLIILGFGLLLFIDCNWLLYNVGEGTLTLLPKIETKAMVIKGPYKYVRNPMIISVILVLLAESFLFNSISILIYMGIFFLINAIYMPLSEEKGMIARFGDEYLHYKNNVRAWIPKFHPYSPREVYDLESPQIEVKQVNNSEFNARIMAERLAYSLERGRHYKRAGYYILRKVMESGLVRGVEIIISGKLDSPRAQKFILRAGSISKSGQADQEGLNKGVAQCTLEEGTIGVIIRVMRLDYVKGDRVNIKHEALKKAQMKQVKKKKQI